MSDVQRFPKPDGSVLVVDPNTGESWTEGSADSAPKDGPRESPFGTPNKPATVVELPKSEDKPAPKPPKQDVTAEMASEAARTTVAYPAGSPDLLSVLRLPFAKRAKAMRLYQEAIDTWQKMPTTGLLDTADKLERYFNGLVAIDNFLECVAANPQAYRNWVENVEDAVFADLFFAYVTRVGLGEPSSSSS